MNEYVPPVIIQRTYLDEDGHMIDYGHHLAVAANDEWSDEGVNVFTNQDRYLPIFTVADALLEHIRVNYDVAIEKIDSFPGHLPLGGGLYSRIVRITPAQPDQAPLTIGFGEEPGAVTLIAGFYSEFDMWFCGCDSCDDRWEDVAESLEHVVLHVVREGLAEVIDKRRHGRARYWLNRRRPQEWSGSVPKTLMRRLDLIEQARVLESLPQGRWSGYTGRK